jgi:Fe-S-cluster containining protein
MALFKAIDAQTLDFAGQSGMSCRHDCGACCENPNIETTVTEMLPLAQHVYATGRADFIDDKINSKHCVFYEPHPSGGSKGRCRVYAYRPGLCRLFGYAARRNKYGKKELVTCKIIREGQTPACQKAQDIIDLGVQDIPLSNAHGFAVANIDPVHGQKLLPINEAFKVALEKIAYRVEKSGQ